MQLDADVIAIEEVDGPVVAARVFPRDKYSIHMSRDHVVQRVGIVVRRGIHYDVNPDVTALDVGPSHALRSGVDITLTLQPAPLRILAVHLKTGCFDRPLNEEPHGACEELAEQSAALIDWITARQADGVAFAVIGDFNRHMDGKDQFWSGLKQAAPLIRATEGHASPCWGGEVLHRPHHSRRCRARLAGAGLVARPQLSRNRRRVEGTPVGSLSGLGALAPPRLSALNARRIGGGRAMKITGITTKEFRWPRHKPITNGKHTYTHVTFAVVEIETSEGITGIGLGGGGEIERATIARLTPMLIGQDPINVERLWHKMWEPKLIGRRGLTTRAISAIDIGLWDIRAKFANLPLYKLLGGFRDRVPTYIAGGYYEEGKGLRELAREMEDNVRMGAKAVKMKVGAVPIAEDVARVRVAREAVGPDVKLMVDANCAYRYYEAIQFAKRIEAIRHLLVRGAGRTGRL